MTDLELELITDLRGVTFVPATNTKRFAKNMIALAEYRPEAELTPKQHAYLVSLHYRFRRQHKSARCLPAVGDVAP